MEKHIHTLMQARFGKDSLLALATVSNGLAYVRTVNALYLDGAFYCVTYAKSNKMQHIALNPSVAVCGEWFTGHGTGKNLGHILLPENAALAQSLRAAFASWYDNGHTNEQDENTVILQVMLTDGVLFDQGKKYTF